MPHAKREDGCIEPAPPLGPRTGLGAVVAATALRDPNAPSRKIAFAIVSLFPTGGLQRDCLAIAEALSARGHNVTIFASRVRGAIDSPVPVAVLPVRSLTNHGRNVSFAAAVARAAAGFDLVVGFDKLPGLDFLYCADPPVEPTARWLAFLQTLFHHRHRTFSQLEAACFTPGANTRLILLSHDQANAYRRRWNTEAGRISVINPLVHRARRRPELRSPAVRSALRAAFGLTPDDFVLLSVGEQPHTKGLDRAIRALAQIERGILLIVGPGPGVTPRLLRLAETLGVAPRLRILGHREDVPEIMAASDLLLHAARRDTTGTVILEAIVNGLPAIVTDVCGFAAHVRASGAGLALAAPYDTRALLAALGEASDEAVRARWSAQGVAYGKRPALYSGVQESLSIIQTALEDGLAGRQP